MALCKDLARHTRVVNKEGPVCHEVSRSGKAATGCRYLGTQRSLPFPLLWALVVRSVVRPPISIVTRIAEILIALLADVTGTSQQSPGSGFRLDALLTWLLECAERVVTCPVRSLHTKMGAGFALCQTADVGKQMNR
jgi:hypothetical protein